MVSVVLDVDVLHVRLTFADPCLAGQRRVTAGFDWRPRATDARHAKIHGLRLPVPVGLSRRDGEVGA